MPFVNISAPGGIDKLQNNSSFPKLDGKKVIVNLSYAGVNHIDIWVREGKSYKVKYPHIPGCDGAGIVEDNPDKNSSLKAGTKVFIYPGISCGRCHFCQEGKDNLCTTYKIIGAATEGTYSSHIAVDENNLIAFDNISMEQAAAFPLTYLTAYHAIITQGKIKKGDTIIINAACSGLGLASIDIARLYGAEIIATVGSTEKVNFLKSIGINKIINYNEEKEWHAKILEYTDGLGADMIYDNIGSAAFNENLDSIKSGGKVILSGTTTGGEVNLDIRKLFTRDITMIGSRMGTKAELLHVAKLFEEGKLEAHIDRIFELSDAQKAHDYMETRKNIGKILLKT